MLVTAPNAQGAGQTRRARPRWNRYVVPTRDVALELEVEIEEVDAG